MAKRRNEKQRRRISVSKRTLPGASPGTLIADPDSKGTAIRVLAYGPDQILEQVCTNPKQLRDIVGKYPVTWIDVDGLGDLVALNGVGAALNIHSLALEDIVNQNQIPKVDEYGKNLFVVVRMAALHGRVQTEQLALFLGDNFVVTFQGSHPGDSLEPVRDRIRNHRGRIRNLGSDYLAYALVDSVVDYYFPVVDELGETVERLEDELVISPVPRAPERIQALKQDLLHLRRKLLPMRDVMNSLCREDHTLIKSDTRIYIRDTHDHTQQLLDIVNTYRELAGGLMDLYLSGLNTRMNEIIKFLTLVSTIFIPLTFIVGVYGMNFDPQRSPWNMPELEWRYGYPLVLLVMAAVAIGLVLFFRRKGWMGITK